MDLTKFLLGLGIAIGLSTSAQAFVVSDFEGGSTTGFGILTSSSGVQPFSGGVSASVINPSSGSNTTKVLSLVASGYNGGLSSGADLGYDFLAVSGVSAQFLANDTLSFNWEVPPSATPSGYSQLYQVILNAPGAGYTVIGGTSAATNNDQNQYPPYNGQTNTFTFNYTAFKTALQAYLAVPGNNLTYLQLGVVTNNGGGAPGEFYFDNFALTSSVPEPSTLGIAAIASLALIARRRSFI